ncbi:MAG: hypothetical protein FJ398_09565 [Verrucomicrobia bacterium]|nr:hypothetical protein [Verrucomicrobiota bacterium]
MSALRTHLRMGTGRRRSAAEFKVQGSKFKVRCSTFHEPDGWASLSSASRVGRVPSRLSGSPGRTRPTGSTGRAHGDSTKGTSHEPFLRTVAFRPLLRRTPKSARKQPEGCGPHGFRSKGHVHGPEAKKASHGL